MKHLLKTLGLAFLLTGCFDDNAKNAEKTTASTAEMPQSLSSNTVPNTENKAGEKLEEKSSTSSKEEQAKTETTSSVVENNEKATSILTPKADNEVKKTLEPKGKRHFEAKATQAKTFHKLRQEPLDNVRPTHHKKPNQKYHKSAKPIEHKVLSQKLKTARNENHEYTRSGYSAEELRVGAQQPMSHQEINYLKMKCVYPFMSEAEIKANHCEVKKVIVR